jgi:hypothetical protein
MASLYCLLCERQIAARHGIQIGFRDLQIVHFHLRY